MSQFVQDMFEQQGDDAVETVSSTPDDIAHVLAGHHGEHLRYVAAWRTWLAWDGRCWRRDRTLLVPELVRQTGRVVARDVGCAIEDEEAGLRLAQRLVSPGSLAATERLARTDRRLAAEPDAWDTDPDRLNTPAGIVDTLTGALSPHDPEARMTRITGVAPAAPGTPHPLWSGFLDRITSGDAALAFYLQRLAGYALTGHGGEQALFFAHGFGANGKSTFMATLARILGSYADVTALDATPARLASELARLDGARLVAVADTTEGRPWPLARLKALTDGTPLPARDIGGAAVAVTPRFKLLLAGNEKPNLARVDEAMRRRLHLIPFAVTIPEDERDPHLMRKLEAEHPAILRWAIDGALAWRKLGLAPPEAVRDARDRHCAAEDVVRQWLDDCTERAGTAWTRSADLYASWYAWARAAGEQPGSQKRLSQLIEARGLAPKRQRTGHHGFAGIRLRENAPFILSPLPLREGDRGRGRSRELDDAESRLHDGLSNAPAEPQHDPLPLTPSRKGRGDQNGVVTSLPAENASSCVIRLRQGFGGQVADGPALRSSESVGGYLAFEAVAERVAAAAQLAGSATPPRDRPGRRPAAG